MAKGRKQELVEIPHDNPLNFMTDKKNNLNNRRSMKPLKYTPFTFLSPLCLLMYLAEKGNISKIARVAQLDKITPR